MPFRKRLLSSQISLVIVSGLFLPILANEANAQLTQYACRSNASGDGWICEAIGSGDSPSPDNQRQAITAPPPAPTDDQEQDAAENEAPTRDAQASPITPPGDDQPSASAEPGSSPADVIIAEETNTSPLANPPSPNETSDTPDTAVHPITPSIESAADSIASLLPGDDMDWLAREAMTAEQLLLVPANCCGAFIDASGLVRSAENSPELAGTNFLTTSGIQQVSANMVTIDGDIVVQQGYRRMLNNGTTSIDQEQDTVLMEGDAVFREPNVLLRGSSAYVDNAAGVNRLESAQYVLHDLRAHGSADSIVYSSDSGLITLQNGEFSRCEPDSGFWHIQAKNIVLNQELGRGYATGASLRIKDVPVFYYPFTMAFPLGDERLSGFLAPSTGSTRSGGFDFELPYYFNLAPNYDATLSPRLISDRGVLTSAELRYLSSWSMNTLNMSYLGGDKMFDENTLDLPGTDSPQVEDRWFLGYEHYGRLGRNFSTMVDYNAVSDDDYFYDLGSTGLNVTSRTHLNRQGQLNFNSSYLRGNLNVRRIQVLDPLFTEGSLGTPYDRLPQLNFDSDAYLPAGFRVRLKGQATAFDRSLDQELFSPGRIEDGVLVTGQRINLEPELSWSLENPGWFVRAEGKYNYFAYKLKDQAVGTADDPDFGIATYSFDSGLIFERSMSSGFTQTLEPRVYYLNSEYEDQDLVPLFDTSELNFSFSQLFRDNRFSGGDRVSDADQVSLAITTRILDERGKERARFSFGQIQYFEDRLVNLKSPSQTFIPSYSPLASTSALAGEFAYTFSQRLKLNADVQWNEDVQEVEEGSLALRYQSASDKLLNLTYRYRGLATDPNLATVIGIDKRIKQTDISGVWPLSPRWKLLGRWNYDHSNSRNLESFAGIEYSNCCATIRVVGREWVDEDELFLPNIEPNRGIFVQFTLNGLGNITGGGISGLLEDGIWGFRETEYE